MDEAALRRRQRRREILARYALSGFELAQRRLGLPDPIRAEQRGARLALLLYHLDRKHRERTHQNLALALPDHPNREKLAKDVWRHFGRVAAEFMRTPLRTHQEVLDSTEVEGWEHFEHAESLGKGVIAVTAHFGNWERFAHWCTAIGRHISVVARDANQGDVQERMAQLREMAGIEVLSRGNAARNMLVRLRRNELVGLLPDQNSDECFVPFFGLKTGSVLGPAVLHQRTGAPLLPAYYVRTAPGRYKTILLPVVDPENTEKDPVVITAELNARLESAIRRYPEQWLWMHDRWKESREQGFV